MKLKTRFVLAVTLVLTGVAAVRVYRTNQMREEAFMDGVRGDMDKMQCFVEAARGYARDVMRPAVAKETPHLVFPAQSGPLVARGIFERFRKNHPAYRYKEASDNPLNELNRIDDVEARVLDRLRADRNLTEYTEFMADGAGGEWYVAGRPIVVEASCLECHGDPNKAPADLTARYGKTHGYGWRVGDVVAASTVRVPTSELRAAQMAKQREMLMRGAGVVAMLLVGAWVCAEWFVCRPVERIGRRMRKIAESRAYEESLPEAARKDELGESARAFNAVLEVVRRTVGELKDVNEHLEARVRERTAELRRNNAQLAAVHETAFDCVIVATHDWRVSEFNAAAERTFGIARADAVGRPLSDFVLPPSGHGGTGFLRSEEGTLLGRLVETRGRRRGGEEFPAEVAVTAARLDGPPVYVASLRDVSERKRAEAERERLHGRLLVASRQAGMAEVATGVLHDVGNVLNSINVSASVVTQALRASEVKSLTKAGELIEAHRANLRQFLTTDERGRHLPEFVAAVARCLGEEQRAALAELDVLARGINHLKEIVASQQAHARGAHLLESVDAAALVETALTLQREALERNGIAVERRFATDVPRATLEKHKALQVLMNLIGNANEALCERPTGERRLTVTIETRSSDGSHWLRIRVADNGVGIPPANLRRIFDHGFTTRADGHGFGLHSAASAAREMGGTLTASSDGVGRGAAFTLELPLTDAGEGADQVGTAAEVVESTKDGGKR
jgi:PAS domain S-box-containing protein